MQHLNQGWKETRSQENSDGCERSNGTSRRLDKTQIFVHLYGSHWEPLTKQIMHLKKRFWHEQYLFTTILLIGPRQKHPKMAQDFQRLWQCWYRTACTDYHRRAWFGFLAALVHIDLHGTRFSPVFFLAAACTHMSDGKPSGKSVLVGMRYKTLPSQDEVLAPCHPQIRKMQQTHNSKKVTLQFFLEWFAWARWGFCQPTPPLCAHHMGSMGTKADQFFQKALLKVSMQDSGPILLPGLSQKTPGELLKKLAPIRPIPAYSKSMTCLSLIVGLEVP